MTSESHYQVYGREQGVYPMPHKDRSYETVTSATPSDPAGYQTDPTSSDNSSIDRISPAKRAEPVNDYGIGFSQPQAYEVQNFGVGSQVTNRQMPPPPPAPQLGEQADAPPPVPRKASVLHRQTSQPGNSTDKRKSWFSRRFSKNG
jgi:hypothetical protein